MTNEAKQHLDTAKELIAQGDSFYWKAGEEIVAAQKADPTLSNGEIGKWFDRSASWVRLLVAHVTTSQPDASIDWQRGSHGTTAEIEAAVEKKLSDPEYLGEVIASNPKVAQAVARAPKAIEAIGSAALDDTLARHREHHTGTTVGQALGDAALRDRLKNVDDKYDRMKEIRSGIHALYGMDVEEFVRHHDWEYDSDSAPSLRTVGRELDGAIENLQTLRDRITARLLEIG